MVSLVMATYNGEKFIKEQLTSILKQTRHPDEVIISDDGSTDHTLEIVDDFIRKYDLNNWKVLIRPTTSKEYPPYVKISLNFIDAAKETNGDIIFFSDQDDIWHSNKIEAMTGLMMKNPQIYTLVCNRSFIDKNGDLLKSEVVKGYEKYSLSKITMLHAPIEQVVATGMCMSIRRCVLDDILEINSPHHYYHDYSFGIIASVRNGLYFYNEVLASHRRHEDNLTVSLNSTRTNNERLKLYDKRISGLLFILDVIAYFSHDDLFNKEKLYYGTCIEIFNKRIVNYRDRRLLSALLMLRYVPKYMPFRSYIGDIIYLLKFEKYFR